MTVPLRPASRRMLAPGLLFVAAVVALVSSLGAPLVPTIAKTDHVSFTSAQWSLTVTMLVGAVATPILGRLAGGRRRKLVIVNALGMVFVGCVLAALPAGFAWLLAGRALQGCGVGLGALAMGVARAELSGERASRALAALAVTTVAGVGLGYPVTGLIADRLGLHAAFWVGAAVTGLAVVVAAVVVPPSDPTETVHLDVAGAVLLAGALTILLLAISNGEQWGWTALPTLLALLVVFMLASVWVRHELRREDPLVELALLRNSQLLAAHVTSLIAGAGMYLLLSLIVRFVQTPPSQGYGFGASVVLSGLILVPFSVASVTSNRLLRVLSRWMSPSTVMPAGATVFVIALIFFATHRDHLWQIFLVMALAGIGAGCTFAAMPSLIVAAVGVAETSSSMALNQVLRIIGFAVGSAVSATVLDAYTPSGALLPSGRGYTVGGLFGAAVWLAAAAVGAALAVRRGAPHTPIAEGVEEDAPTALVG